MILGVEGSPRRKGNSHTLLDIALGEFKENKFKTSTVHLRELQMSSCIGCEGCRKAKKCVGLKDGMTDVYPLIDQSQGLVIISPVHNYNITAWMKAFIDRLYCYYDFEDTIPRAWSSRLAGQNRKAVVVAIAEQDNNADMGFVFEAMALPLKALGYDVVDEVKVLKTFKAGTVIDNTEALVRIKEASLKLRDLL